MPYSFVSLPKIKTIFEKKKKKEANHLFIKTKKKKNKTKPKKRIIRKVRTRRPDLVSSVCSWKSLFYIFATRKSMAADVELQNVFS